MQQQLAELLVALGPLRRSKKYEAVSALLGDAYRGLFGLDRRFLQMMQPAQVAAILGGPEKLTAFAQLIAEEADLLRVQGDVESTAAMALGGAHPRGGQGQGRRDRPAHALRAPADDGAA